MTTSPLSIAQIRQHFKPFDVVIFDEASQIPVWDAIGAIARGQQVIVVGDPKQLPPTTFFDRSDDGYDDASDLEDLESILDECLAANIPHKRLAWHYRSRHELLSPFQTSAITMVATSYVPVVGHRRPSRPLRTRPRRHLRTRLRTCKPRRGAGHRTKCGTTA